MLRIASAADRSDILEAESETATIAFGRAPTPDEIHRRSERLDSALRKGQILIGERAGRVVGYCWAERTAEGVLSLVDFYVDKSLRGTGLAQWLLKRAAETWRARGERSLHLVIADRNTRSVRFFSRLGAVCRDDEASDGLRAYELPLERLA